MSLILDALKRAERERRAGQTPMPLDALPVAPAEPADSSARRWLLPALLGAIVAGGAVYALLLWRHPAAAPPASPVIATVTAVPASTLPTASAPEVATPTTPPEPTSTPSSETAIDDSRIATLDDLVDDHHTSGDAQPPPKNQPTNDNARGGRPPDIATSRADGKRPSATEALPPFEQPVGPPSVEPAPPEPAARPSLPPATESPTPAPTSDATAQPTPAAVAPATNLKDMSPNFRAEFPAFTVDVHVYNDEPARRFVMLNGKRYHEGDVTSEGPRVAGIVSEGIVFEWHGERVFYGLSSH